MRIGSLFAGLGGLDLAAEWSLEATTAWQLDMTGEAVRARHFPAAIQVCADVATVDPRGLPPIDVLCAGFSCQDLSCAGTGASRRDLDAGKRTGPTWRGTVRFALALMPEIVILENVPAVLKHQNEIERTLSAWGWTWVKCGAWDAGAPHIRRRAFGVGVLGGRSFGVIDAPQDGRWCPVESERLWSTPRVSQPAEDPAKVDARIQARWDAAGGVKVVGKCESLATQARCWPTATAKGNDNREGASETAVDGLGTAARVWPTNTAAPKGSLTMPRGNPTLMGAVGGSRLNPAWVETLCGLPQGWTLPEGPRLHADPSPLWPRGRYPKGWDRSQLWPGFPWEPSRTLPDGPPVAGRPARIRLLGNCVLPQQGSLAIRTALNGTAQGRLF